MLREWARIGCIGFGGPPAHIALLRDLCVERKRWLDAREFEDALAACNLLPGPASTQLAIFCAWRLRGRPGALAGGAAFIAPGLILILALAALFLAGSPPSWVEGAGAGAGAAVAAVAVQAGASLMPASWQRARRSQPLPLAGLRRAGGGGGSDRGPVARARAAGLRRGRTCRGAPAPRRRRPSRGRGRGRGPRITRYRPGSWLRVRRGPRRSPGGRAVSVTPVPVLAAAGIGGGVLLSLAWVAFKVGALSYGGGFVIIPLMQADAVARYHWMTGAQFLNAVALGQITPGPVVQTVAVVGYAAAGIIGGILAAVIAFAPSFVFVLLGGRHFDRLRADRRAQAFLGGAGPAAIGAILGSAIPLALAITRPWQYAVLAGAAVLLLLRRGVVLTLLCAGAAGVVVALAGGPLPH